MGDPPREVERLEGGPLREAQVSGVEVVDGVDQECPSVHLDLDLMWLEVGDGDHRRGPGQFGDLVVEQVPDAWVGARQATFAWHPAKMESSIATRPRSRSSTHRAFELMPESMMLLRMPPGKRRM